MKLTTTTILAFFFTTNLFSQGQGLFYYTKDGTISLNSVSNRYSVEFKDSVDLDLFDNNNFRYEPLVGKCYEVDGSFGQIYTALSSTCNINPVFLTNGDTPLWMKSSLVLHWKDGTSQAQKTNVINNHGLILLSSNRIFEKYETLSPLSISQLIFETDLVDFCYPSFIAEVKSTEYIPNDPYFDRQWYLHNTGQLTNDGHFGTLDADIDAPEAWEITLGDPNIVIAIIDEGVTSNHPDLPNSRQVRLSGSNMVADDPLGPDDPSPDVIRNHGNACAGIAAAEIDNNEGIAGIAPFCKIMPIKVKAPTNLEELDVLALSITFAVDNGAEIISNSWRTQYSETIISAIEDAIDSEVVVLFGAGNGAGVQFLANSNIDNLISVSASDRNDEVASYSSTGPEVDIAAPSNTAINSVIEGEAGNIWTIDIPGIGGDNPWLFDPFDVDGLPPYEEEIPASGTNHLSYTGRFSGTSASTPMVAGVVALMLSVNPCLSVAQVNDILANTAEKVGGYDYNWSEEKPGHSVELGYGRLNAFLAVEAAQSMLSPGLDLYTKDTPDEFGVEPNETSEFLWVSEDIWVRNQDDGFTNQFHENPEYTVGQSVFVYVRVRNRGCDPSLGSEQLKLYWAKAATALTWPGYWNGSITEPALMGNQIGSQPIDIIDAGEDLILKFEWTNVPNPDDYNLINDQPWHFCLLSRIVAANDPMNNELDDGTWNLGHNVKQNNNIAWKNVSIVDIVPGIVGGPFEDDKIVGATVAIGNASNSTNTFDFHFNVPSQYIGNPITQASEVRMTLDEKTWQKWQAGGFINSNVKITRADRRQVLIESANASIKNLTYLPKERSSINVSFNVLTREMTGKTIFEYNVVQTLVSTDSILGGERYKVKLPLRDAFSANAGIDERIVFGDSVILHAAMIAEPAIFNWYNELDSIIHTGPSVKVAPNHTAIYKLEVIASSDGFKDYDTKEVEVLMGMINSISPNPTSAFVNVTYSVAASANAKLLLVNAFDGSTNQFLIDSNLNIANLDLSSFSTGVYSLSLVVNGNLVDQKGIVIQ